MKIIATTGPRVKNRAVLKDLLELNTDIFRFNFSHGTVEDFNCIYDEIKSIKENVHIMLDLSGSKIRISDKLPYIYKIYNGEEVIFCGENNYRNVGYSVKRGESRIIPLNINGAILENTFLKNISMKDDTMQFKIIGKVKNGIKVKVLKGGIVRAGKGCNIKGFPRKDIQISDNDKAGIDFAIEKNIDIICQSFVENKTDIEQVLEYIKKKNVNYNPKIWAKIETPEGVLNAEKIIPFVDGIVIGRGDLVPESSLINAPIYQDKLIKKIKDIDKDKEIIIATHILNSMKCGKTAELSEVDCIYNLIKKGVTGFLLAGETSVGKAPVKTVSFLKELILNYEKE